MTRTFSARTIHEATQTVEFIHTVIARGAAHLMAKDARIQPGGAVTAMMQGTFERIRVERPHVMATYWRALALLGIGRGEMTYHRFLSYVDPDIRLRLTTDRKVAG